MFLVIPSQKLGGKMETSVSRVVARFFEETRRIQDPVQFTGLESDIHKVH